MAGPEREDLLRPEWWKRVERAPVVLRVKRRVRQWLGTEVQSRVEVSCRVEEHGGWWICPDRIPRGGLAYCFGVGQDLRLERHLAERLEMTVLAFDPTPWTVTWVRDQELPERLRYVELGVAAFDGTAFFHEPDTPTASHSMVREGAAGRGSDVEVRRLPTLLRQHGHDRIDLLKLDIEGAEYEVLEEMVDAGIRPRVILVEFHHRFRGVGIEKTEAALERLRRQGYGIFHIAPSGREHGLVLREGP